MQEKKGLGVVRIIVIIVALAVLLYSGYRLYLIFNDYRMADKTYSDVRDKYTKPAANPADEAERPDVLPKYEDADSPLALDWDELRSLNPDIIGWIYVEGEPEISYPICWREGDDDFYLHRSHLKEYLYAGAIFLEGLNHPDLSDPLSIIYGHNMKNGSMFAKLKNFLSQEKYDANPYFWIFTPEADYRYHIFSVLQTTPDSDAYTLFSESGGEFLEYEKKMQAASAVKNDIPLYEDDKCVMLSTCVSDHVHRTVVLGRCVSSSQPAKTTDDPAVSTNNNKEVSIPPSLSEPDEAFDIERTIGDLFGVER